MNILLLDDNPHRITFFQNGLKKHKLTICRHASAAIKALKKQTFDVIFLDHDLEHGGSDSESANSGSAVARFIADHEIDCPCIVLHTENDRARDIMKAILEECHTIPYGKLKKSGLYGVLKLAVQAEPGQDRES